MDKQPDKSEQFVAYVLGRCTTDKGFAARLRRADNPDTEAQCYDILARFGINLENDDERLPYCVIGAALARAKIERDGTAGLGKALKSCFEDGDQGDLRLRRLLTCDALDELCRILRPVLSLVDAKGKQPLNYARLLRELTLFYRDAKSIKLGWAQAYYGKSENAPDVSSPKSNEAQNPPHAAIQQASLLGEEG